MGLSRLGAFAGLYFITLVICFYNMFISNVQIHIIEIHYFYSLVTDNGLE